MCVDESFCIRFLCRDERERERERERETETETETDRQTGGRRERRACGREREIR